MDDPVLIVTAVFGTLGFLFTVLMSIIGFLIRRKMESIDSHLVQILGSLTEHNTRISRIEGKLNYMPIEKR
jgi:hypothetical protein